MASTRHCTAALARLAISTPCTARPALPTLSARNAAPAATALFSTTSSLDKAVSKKTGPTLQQQALQKERAKRKKKQSRHKEYKYATPSQEERWSLCDAMRYVHLSPFLSNLSYTTRICILLECMYPQSRTGED